MAEGEATDKHSNAGDKAVEEIEGAYGSNTDKVEQGALDTEIREGLVQAFEYPVPPAGCRVCLHRKPLTPNELNG